MLVAAVIIGIAVIVVNAYSTWLVLNEDGYEFGQKTCQIAITWLIPIVGALIFGGLILAERRNDKCKYRSGNYNATGYDGGLLDHSSDSSDSN